jgi:hypothetical protein
MVEYTIINGSGSDLINIPLGQNTPKYSIAINCSLSAAEVAYVAELADVAVMKNQVTYQQRRNVARILKYSQDRFIDFF